MVDIISSLVEIRLTDFGKVDEIKIGVTDIIFSPNNFVSHTE